MYSVMLQMKQMVGKKDLFRVKTLSDFLVYLIDSLVLELHEELSKQLLQQVSVWAENPMLDLVHFLTI